MRRLCLIALVALAACEPGIDELTATARASLDAGRYAEAVAQTDEALASATDATPAQTLGLEKIRIEALARQGHGNEAAAALEGLAGRFKAQLTPALYLKTADQVREAGNAPEASEVLAAADARFPDDAAIDLAIEDLKALASDDAGLEDQLRSLGYL